MSQPQTHGAPGLATVPDPHVERVLVSLVDVGGGKLRAVAEPDPFVARANHYLIWSSDYPFSVAFESPKPVTGPPSLESKEAGGRHQVVAQVRPDADTGINYKYFLTISDGGRLYTSDPMGDVDPDPDRK